MKKLLLLVLTALIYAFSATADDYDKFIEAGASVPFNIWNSNFYQSKGSGYGINLSVTNRYINKNKFTFSLSGDFGYRKVKESEEFIFPATLTGFDGIAYLGLGYSFINTEKTKFTVCGIAGLDFDCVWGDISGNDADFMYCYAFLGGDVYFSKAIKEKLFLYIDAAIGYAPYGKGLANYSVEVITSDATYTKAYQNSFTPTEIIFIPRIGISYKYK